MRLSIPNPPKIIAWLAMRADGAQTGCRSTSAFAFMQANATTPSVPFRKGAWVLQPGFRHGVKAFPLPAGGGIEAQTGYQCDHRARTIAI